MSMDVLLDHFDLLLDAPDSIPKLRELILQLAVQGKLVPQDPSDEPASEHMSDVLHARKLLVKNGELRKPKQVAKLEAQAIPFEVPSSWEWRRLADCADVLDHLREPVSKKERAQRTQGKDSSQLYPYYGATQQAGWIDDFIFDEELVLLGEDGAPFLKSGRSKAYVVSGRYWVNNHAHVLRGRGVINRYLCHWLDVFDYSGRVTGTTRLKLNQSKMLSIPVPVPPLEEQKRIVAKVDALMRLCDTLKAQQQQRQTTRVHLNNAALDALLAAENGDVLRRWQFVQVHFDLLYAAPQNVAGLRQAILQLAVQGKLSGKDWPRVRLGSNVSISGGNTPSKKRSDFWNGNIPWFSPKDIKSKHLFDSQDHITEKAVKEGSAKLVDPGAVLVVIRGMILAHTVPSAVLTIPAAVNQDMKVLRSSEDLDPEYLMTALWACNSELLERVESSSHGTRRFPTESLLDWELPLPTLEEQKCVVAKAEELMRLCDALEEQLARSQEQGERLLQAVLHAAFAEGADVSIPA